MAQSNLAASQPVRQAAIEGVVIRCGCGDPESHHGQVCPKGRREVLGTLVYWHPSPFVRLAYRIRRALGAKTFWRK